MSNKVKDDYLKLFDTLSPEDQQLHLVILMRVLIALLEREAAGKPAIVHPAMLELKPQSLN